MTSLSLGCGPPPWATIRRVKTRYRVARALQTSRRQHYHKTVTATAAPPSERVSPPASPVDSDGTAGDLPAAACRALEQLQKLLAGQQPPHTSVAARQLGQLAAALRGAPPVQLKAAKRHAALGQLLQALAASAGAADAVHIASVLQSCIFLQLKLPREQLEAFGGRLAEAAAEASPADVSRGAWALSRLGFCPPRLLAAVEEQALAGSWVQELDIDSMAGLLWVCNRASHSSPALLGVLTEGIRLAAGAGAGAGAGAAGPRRSRGAAAEGGEGPAATAEAEAEAQPRLNARQVSTALYSCAAMRYTPSQAVLEALCSQARRLVPDFNPQGLCNVAWSLGRLGHTDPDLMEALAQASLQKLQEFNPHELALLASGFSGTQYKHPAIMAAAAERLATYPGFAATRDLSHLLASLAQLGCHPGEATLAALDRRAAEMLREQGMRGGRQGGRQAGAAAAGAGSGGPGFAPVGLCWSLWAMARLGYHPRELLKGVDEVWCRTPVQLYELGPEDAGRALWALGRLGHRSGALLEELALVLRRLLPSMPPQSLAMALHGYASLGFTPHELADGAAEHMAARLPEYPPQSVVMMVWAFAKLGLHPGRGLPGGGTRTEDGTPLLEAAEGYAVAHAQQLPTQSIALLCWALASLHHHPSHAFLDAVAARLAASGGGGGSGSGGGSSNGSQGTAAGEAAGGAAAMPPPAAAAGPEGAAGPEEAALAQPEAGEDSVGLQSLSLVAWAFAQWGHSDPRLLGCIRGCVDAYAAQAERGRAPALAPATVSNLAFALAKQDARDAELVGILRQAAEDGVRSGQYNSQELVNLLYCHAALGVHPPPPFLADCVAALRPMLPTCDASLTALAVHSLATLRYAPPDDWMEAAVRCVAAAVEEELWEAEQAEQAEHAEQAEEEEDSHGEQPQEVVAGTAAEGLPGDEGEEEEGGRGAQRAAAGGAGDALQVELQRERRPRGAKGGPAERRGAKQGQRGGGRRPKGKPGSRGPSRVHVTLVAKLLWGCGHLGYKPPADLLLPLTDSTQWALSHARGRTTVLHVADAVRLLWALAVLEQYATPLYRTLCFRSSRLPRGVPRSQQSIQLLQQVVMLSNCEARFVSMPLRGNSLLPEWLREGLPVAPRGEQAAPARPRAEQAASAKPPKKAAASKPGPAAAGAASSEASSSPVAAVAAAAPAAATRPHPYHTSSPPEPAQQQEQPAGQAVVEQAAPAPAPGPEGSKEAAEVLAAALRAVGCRPTGVRQLLYGDWVVIYCFQGSGQAAVLPWLPALRAVNEPGRAVGSALATLRVLAGRGFPVVVGGEDAAATVAECLELWT